MTRDKLAQMVTSTVHSLIILDGDTVSWPSVDHIHQMLKSCGYSKTITEKSRIYKFCCVYWEQAYQEMSLITQGYNYDN